VWNMSKCELTAQIGTVHGAIASRVGIKRRATDRHMHMTMSGHGAMIPRNASRHELQQSIGKRAA
jgi:hypothetical protein